MSVINTFIQWNIVIIMSLTQFLMTQSRQFKLKQGVKFFAVLKEPLQKGVGNEIGLCMCKFNFSFVLFVYYSQRSFFKSVYELQRTYFNFPSVCLSLDDPKSKQFRPFLHLILLYFFFFFSFLLICSIFMQAFIKQLGYYQT